MCSAPCVTLPESDQPHRTPLAAPQNAPFLARQGYVQRRRGDAARLLPVLGLLLFMLPLLWVVGEAAPRTAFGVIYVFAVWVALIMVAGWLAPRLMSPPPDGPDQTER